MATTPLPRLILVKDRDRARDLAGPRPSDVVGLTRVRRGAYVDDSAWRNLAARERYELLVRSTVPQMRRPAPVSHESAAVLLGMPIIGAFPKEVHVLEKTAAGGRGSTLVVRHGTRSEPEVVLVDGIAVASAARTVVDLARTRPFASGLAAADFALATGLTTPDELAEELLQTRRTRGHHRARRVLRYADGRSESVGESLSRAQMIELDLPLPELQQEFYDDDGFIGRTDFWWPKIRLIGEFDGQVKFGRGLAESGDDVREALWKEKRREDRLRRLGNGVVRWIWDEAWRRDAFAALLAHAGVR